MDDIIALISTFKEGNLVQGCIRSIFPWCHTVIVWDGATQHRAIKGEKTNIGNYRGSIVWQEGFWNSEHEKRTMMLKQAKRLHPETFWILTIDADEILVWGEYLQDWIGVLNPGYPESEENVVPLKRTEAAWDPNCGFITDVSPSRLIHSSMVEEYVVSCWKMRTPDNKYFDAGHYRAQRQPLYGEPHIHHRPYLRRFERAKVRAHQLEEKDFVEKLQIEDVRKNLPNLAQLDRLLEDEHFRAD